MEDVLSELHSNRTEVVSTIIRYKRWLTEAEDKLKQYDEAISILEKGRQKVCSTGCETANVQKL